MAESKINNPDVRAKLFKEAKNKPIAFAVCVGKSPDDTAVAVHKTLGAKQVFTQLKSECKLVKGAWGTLTVEGKIATFECEKSVKGLEKKLKLYLKAESLPFKPLVTGVEPDEDDDEELVDEVAAEAPARPAAADPPVEAAGKTASSTAPMLAALNSMTPAIKAAVAANPGGRAAIVAGVAAVKKHVEADDAAAAKAALLELGALLKGGAAAGGGAVDLPAVLVAWRSASEAVDAQVGALQSALRGTNDADFERIAEFGLNGITGNHRVGLQTALMNLQGANDETRPAFAKAARGAVAGFRGFIESDRVVGLVDENPFVSTTIRKTLGDALGTLDESLAKVG